MKSEAGKGCACAFVMLALGWASHANAFVISDLGGTPTEGWDGPGLGAATIDYFLGWTGAPDGTGLSSTVTLSQLEQEVANAAATWSSVADITFNYLGNAIDDPVLGANPWGTPDDKAIVIYFHEDEAANDFPFVDGAGLTTVFAHAYGPPDIMGNLSFEFAGNIHLDGAENWLTGLSDGTSYSSVGGLDLETILLHELGHSLGLDHSGQTSASPGGSVMAAFSNQAVSTLGADDILGIRQLYSFTGDGGDGGEGDPEPDPTPVPEPGTLTLLALGLLGLARSRRRLL